MNFFKKTHKDHPIIAAIRASIEELDGQRFQAEADIERAQLAMAEEITTPRQAAERRAHLRECTERLKDIEAALAGIREKANREAEIAHAEISAAAFERVKPLVEQRNDLLTRAREIDDSIRRECLENGLPDLYWSHLTALDYLFEHCEREMKSWRPRIEPSLAEKATLNVDQLKEHERLYRNRLRAPTAV